MAMIVVLVRLLFDLCIIAIIIRACLSWLNIDPRNPVRRFLCQVTDPILNPIRARLGYPGQVDFSPLVAIVLLLLLERLVVYGFNVLV